MNGNKQLKKHDVPETVAAVLILYQHHFSSNELYSIKAESKAKWQ